ncbi:hypothetical protein DMH04_38485 [Kibdelosporangium aridum]|uniref:Uncharacterized protein n=1 Tax=Kibdelosporangium aridum TaxID=2030 RepID=A0A428YYG0_KIBAR|nr:hypothetical protein DMH04_38485 [Kibdelosporangium aridum]
MILAIVGANVVNAGIAIAARAMTDDLADFGPLDPFPYIFLTTVGIIAGAVGWAVVRRRADDPAAVLRWLVPAVVLLSFVPDFFQFDRGGVVGVVALLVMHVVVAAFGVAAYRRAMPL